LDNCCYRHSNWSDGKCVFIFELDRSLSNISPANVEALTNGEKAPSKDIAIYIENEMM
jgi:hypothetical protein